MLVDSFGVTYLLYPLMVDASTQGEEHSQAVISHCEGKLKSTKEQVYTTHNNDDDTPLIMMMPKKLCSRLLRASGKCPTSTPSSVIPIKVTRAVQREFDSSLLTKSTEKSH